MDEEFGESSSSSEEEKGEEQEVENATSSNSDEESAENNEDSNDEQNVAAVESEESENEGALQASPNENVQSESDDAESNTVSDQGEKSSSDGETEQGENEIVENKDSDESNAPGGDNSPAASENEEGGVATPIGSDDNNYEKAASDDSSADEAAPSGDKQTNDLFGDADDISSDDEKEPHVQSDLEPQTNKFVQSSDEEMAQGSDGENARDESQEDEVQETRIEVEIPKINTDLGNKVHFVRFPNFVSVETRPFDAAVYEDEIDEDELMDEEGRTRLKLKVENTIRWRKYVDENGIELTESNSRMVRWSDGSMSLYLGSEIFDVHVMPLQGDHNHLFIRQGTGLQGQAVFKTKLTFRPHSTKSATHRKMTNRLAMRHNQNQQKVRVLPIAGQNPETRKAKMMKEEEDQLKAHMRREAQKRRMRERQHARGLTANYMDDRMDAEESGDETGAISLSAIKNSYKHGRGNIYSSDSDSADEKQLQNVKRLESESDSDEKQEKTDEVKKKKYVVSDEEESENDDVAMENE